MPKIGLLASFIAGNSRKPLQATLKRRLVRPFTTSARRTCGEQGRLSQQLPPLLGGGASVGSPTCAAFSAKSGADSDHIASDGGVLLPRHQAKVSSSGSTRVKDILVNRSGLLPARPDFSENFKSDKQGLARELEQMINLNGPITVAEYMLYALQHPTLGYYMRKESKIGQRGDFVTAPEISQVFGELIGVWCVATWNAMGSPSSFNMIELGPGKGTLMTDVLRAASSFPAFRKALTLHLVETSDDLRALQVKALNAKYPDGADTDSTPSSSPLPSIMDGGITGTGRLESRGPEGEDTGGKRRRGMLLPDGGEVFWHTKMDQVPKGPSLFIAQEFLDALPIHKFQYTAKGWREILVDMNVKVTETGAQGHGVVDAGTEVKDTRTGGGEVTGDGAGNSVEDFRFVVSAEETAAVKTFLKSKEDAASTSSKPAGDRGEKVGDRLEVSPESMLIAAEVAKRVAEHGGGALFVDYGENHALEDSLRCFKGHKEVPVLSDPGLADMTADVDFSLLRRVASGVKGVRTHGPVGQGQFLGEMGIGERLQALADQPHVTEEQTEMMIDGYVRLVDPKQMGTRYKVLAICDERLSPAPPGFLSAEHPPPS